jgi:RsiW-degrading membrane proteinase PrsW (M82 family)
VVPDAVRRGRHLVAAGLGDAREREYRSRPQPDRRGAIVFTAYVYERDHEVPSYMLLWCFIAGGALGVIAASVLEYRTILALGAMPTLAIGLIEESCKLDVPVLFFLMARHRREIDGLPFGVASGLGFAALESMGYGLTMGGCRRSSRSSASRS